jgi:hypothetical protein
MRFKLQVLDAAAQFADEVNIATLSKVITPRLIDKVVDHTGRREQRRRKLSAGFCIWFCIALNLFADEPYQHVLSKLVKGLRYIWRHPNLKLPVKSALCTARYRLGVAPMVELFHQTAKPLADLSVAGAYLFGLRLMAIDGATETLADTPENVACFGRHTTARGASAFPQAQIVYLSECCTHAIVDAGIWPLHTSERVGGLRLLRSVEPGMLVMIDIGFFSYDMVHNILFIRGAHVLARVGAHMMLKPVTRLNDGSYTAYIYPSDYRRRKAGERLLVRVIEYTVSDPNRPGYGIIHRLVTSLLNPDQAPALDLACAYHERWEIELAIDEMDTHQREAGAPLRSRKPLGVIQEFYALLIAFNAICALRLQAALFAGLDPDRISFVVTLRKLCESIDQFQQTAPRQRPWLFKRLLQDIANERLLPRRCRSNPRVVKRKMSNFLLKRDYHRQWPQPATGFRDAIQILK